MLCIASMTASQSAFGLTPSGFSADNEQEVVTRLRPVLYSARKVGRFYFDGDCLKTSLTPDRIVFRKTLDLSEPLSGASGVDAIRSIFRNERNVTITEKPVGVIRIQLGNVMDAILRTRMIQLKLDSSSQYDSLPAILSVERAPEVRSRMNQLGLQLLNHVIDYIVVQPHPGIPHLPEQLSNITLDDALDLVANTWNGVVSFGTCRSAGLIDIRFFPNDRFFYIDRNWPGFASTPLPSCIGSPCANPTR